MPTQDMDRRITFHDDLQVMEVDFSGFNFDSSATVNAFYDRIEDRIAKTGEELWFFLVNLCDTRIDQSAWFAYSRRGRALNMAHSMGSVRFDASEITRKQIERDANTRTTAMAGPTGLMVLGFVTLLLYPAITAVAAL